MTEKLPIKKETIIRTVILVIALINQILSATNHSPLPISDATIEQLLSTLITVVASVWAWWKNNSFTQEAIQADEYMHSLKDGDSDELD